jgi:hypothetical protein
VLFFMPLKKVEGDWRIKVKAVDWTGALIALGGTSVLILGLTWGGGEYSWGSVHVISTLVVGCVVSAAFGLWQWKGTKYPLVPRRSRPVRTFFEASRANELQYTSSNAASSTAPA